MRKPFAIQTVTTDEALAIAFAAFRHNNGYVKTTIRTSEPNIPTIWSNKELVSYTLAHENKKGNKHHWIPENFVPLVTTDEDIKNIENAKTHVKKYLVGMISNEVSAFQQEVYDALYSEEIPVTKIGLLSYIPELIVRETTAAQVKKVLKAAFSDSVELTGKVEGIITVISCMYVERHESHIITASLGTNLVKFFYKSPFEIGANLNITAKAKNSSIDPKIKCTVTYINYLKIKKK